MQLATAILAGGASQRMGRDKALLRYGSQTFLEHTIAIAAQVTSQVVVVGREQPAAWPHQSIYFLSDAQPGAGPLAGLVTALRYAKSHNLGGVLLVACDMPGLKVPVFQWLLAQANAGFEANRDYRHGCVAVNDGQLEPLFTIYTIALLEVAEEHLVQNRRALHRLIENGAFKRAHVPPQLRPALLNVNTPEEFVKFSGLDS